MKTNASTIWPSTLTRFFFSFAGISRPIHVVPPYSDNATTWWLFFPVTNLTSGQTRTTSDTQESNLITATLRIYRKPQNGPSDDQTSPTTSPIIHLYHVNVDDQLLLVDSRSVTPTGHLSYYSWDVSDSVRQWSHDSNLNRGLLVTCSPCDNDLGRFLWRTTDHQHHHQSDVTVPSVVVHVAQEPVELSRSKRNAQSLEDALISWSPFSTPQGIVDCPKKKSGEMTCCRKKLKINMVELGLDRWILQPRQFDAHYCVGKCPSKHSPASTHALIQGYLAVHRLKSRHKKPPQPCCAPSQLAKLDIMFFNKTGHLVIQPWDNVVVSKCACS